ncbi:hypothetical protein LZ016_07315 [Sphingomonas sp. SM33]|uniref:Uncharacterized protein n=1 Tax=Sphingomonas telluris TaxID=2907998 RepID=A0ABS9VLR6_9SPHN|nr:hypothetical protein [Sphingomonas telluris]MCH8615907.1 hypothetical protein [Sphingomonas telluris]
MKLLKLYKIEPIGLPVTHVAARSEEQAMQMYVTSAAARELPDRAFSVELVALDGLNRDKRIQLEALLATSTEGIARYDQDAGWVIDSEGWSSFDSDEMELSGVRIFEMRDPTPIEAFVLAADFDRASELFGLHLQAHGGDRDSLLYREWSIDALPNPGQSVVREALELHREGLLTSDAVGRWVFITPLADRSVAVCDR